MKSFLTAVLLVFVAGSVAYLVIKESRGPAAVGVATTSAAAATGAAESSAPVSSKAEAAEPERKVIVYYFHGTARCKKCLTMEAFAREAVAANVIPAAPEGAAEWRVVNVDGPGNGHFVRDFGLTASAVVVAETENGTTARWKNLEHIWDLVSDEAAFKDYVTTEALDLLESEP